MAHGVPARVRERARARHRLLRAPASRVPSWEKMLGPPMRCDAGAVVVGHALGRAGRHREVVRQARVRFGGEVRRHPARGREAVEVRRRARADDRRVRLVLHHDPDDAARTHRAAGARAAHPARGGDALRRERRGAGRRRRRRPAPGEHPGGEDARDGDEAGAAADGRAPHAAIGARRAATTRTVAAASGIAAICRRRRHRSAPGESYTRSSSTRAQGRDERDDHERARGGHQRVVAARGEPDQGDHGRLQGRARSIGATAAAIVIAMRIASVAPGAHDPL